MLQQEPGCGSGRPQGGSRGRRGRCPTWCGSQRAVGGGDDAHIHLDGLVFAHPLQLAALDEAQKLRLQGQGHLPDFVEEQGAPVGGLDAPDAPLHGACKRSPRVAEELGLEQGFGDGGTVDGNERLAASRRKPMQGLGHKLLARARRADDSTGVLRGATRRMRRLTSSMQSPLPTSSGNLSTGLDSGARNGSSRDSVRIGRWLSRGGEKKAGSSIRSWARCSIRSWTWEWRWAGAASAKPAGTPPAGQGPGKAGAGMRLSAGAAFQAAVSVSCERRMA